jgi:hypothetical protein
VKEAEKIYNKFAEPARMLVEAMKADGESVEDGTVLEDHWFGFHTKFTRVLTTDEEVYWTLEVDTCPEIVRIDFHWFKYDREDCVRWAAQPSETALTKLRLRLPA